MVELFYGRFLAVGVLEGTLTHAYCSVQLKRYYLLAAFASIVTTCWMVNNFASTCSVSSSCFIAAANHLYRKCRIQWMKTKVECIHFHMLADVWLLWSIVLSLEKLLRSWELLGQRLRGQLVDLLKIGLELNTGLVWWSLFVRVSSLSVLRAALSNSA